MCDFRCASLETDTPYALGLWPRSSDLFEQLTPLGRTVLPMRVRCLDTFEELGLNSPRSIQAS